MLCKRTHFCAKPKLLNYRKKTKTVTPPSEQLSESEWCKLVPKTVCKLNKKKNLSVPLFWFFVSLKSTNVLTNNQCSLDCFSVQTLPDISFSGKTLSFFSVQTLPALSFRIKPCQIFQFGSNLARSFFSGQPLPDLSFRFKPFQLFLFSTGNF